VTRVRIDIEPDPARRLDLFSSGAVDVVHSLSGPQLLDFSRTPANRGRVHLAPVARTTWLGFNTVAGSGYGPQERMAIAQAIDRRLLTDLVFAGSQQARPAADFLPPAVPGHLDRSLPAFDPQAARRSLDQSGFTGPIDLYYSTNPTVGRVATDLKDQLEANTGRTVSLHPLGDFFSQASLDHLPLVIDTWSADLAYPADILDNVLRGGAQFNDLHLADPRIDRALDEGRTAPDLAKALTAYQQAEAAAIDDSRVIPLYSGAEPYLVRNGISLTFTDGPSPFLWESVSEQR
jgi:ABC-type oligopeptide transport system substrate-binding subunit